MEVETGFCEGGHKYSCPPTRVSIKRASTVSLYCCAVKTNSTLLITSSHISAKWKSSFSHSSVCIWPQSLQNLRENTAITIMCDSTAKQVSFDY